MTGADVVDAIRERAANPAALAARARQYHAAEAALVAGAKTRRYAARRVQSARRLAFT